MKHYTLVENYIAGKDTAGLTALLESMKYDEILNILEKLSVEKKAVVFESLDEYIAIKI